MSETSSKPPIAYRVSYDNDNPLCTRERPTLKEAEDLAQHHVENGWTDVKVTPVFDE